MDIHTIIIIKSFLLFVCHQLKPVRSVERLIPAIAWDNRDIARIINKGVPIIIKNSPASQWTALKKWDLRYLQVGEVVIHLCKYPSFISFLNH